RVLENLLENAVHHTPRGGTVALDIEAEDGRAKVTVTDTGRGIPPDKINRVFDRFYQVEKNERDRAGGAGLGLAIAKRIVGLHGGDIHVQSRLNAGTAFSFCIPVCAPA
ncbi:MAG TPA: ATP-binding protein, partial [Gammaproteobacteria bacterium]|nr:ATP-binding protein [Gammaproteobacteria bacterium]